MFDIGFSELLLIGIVALVVIGPERLPRVARTAGLLFGRMQRYVAEVKADISREIHADELKKLQDEMHSAVNSIEQSVTQDLRQGSDALQAAAAQIHEIVELPRQADMAAPEQTIPESALSVADAPTPQLELGLESPDAAPVPEVTPVPDAQAISNAQAISDKNT